MRNSLCRPPFLTLAVLTLGAAVGILAGPGPAPAAEEPPRVVTLTQVGCQFVESENGVNHGYAPKSGKDCKEINARTGEARLGKAEALRLKPGKYVFRVTNENVPYELGFWLRGSGLGRLTLPSVSGGGLKTGATKDYVITLEPGRYVYSCPLNPTPDYPLIVEG